MSDYQLLLNDLDALGVCKGDAVLVHSSMKALGTALTPEQVIDALQHALGPEGTLLMPALTYENVTRDHPVFDREETPPCVGLLRRGWSVACIPPIRCAPGGGWPTGSLWATPWTTQR